MLQRLKIYFLQSHLKRLPIDFWVLGLFFVTALTIYYRPLIYNDALYFRDFQIFFAPMKHFLGTAFREGYWPWWNSAIQMGTPFFADLQSGVFYPPSIIFVLFDTPRAMAVSLSLHLVLGQFGTYWLARQAGFDRIPALAAALVYGLGGWSLSCGNMLTLAHSVAWAPWTIFACERLWRSINSKNIAVAAMVITMQMYSGWPEMFILLGITLLVRRVAIPGVWDWRWLFASIVAVSIATGLFMPQFLATLDAFRASERVGGMNIDELLEFSATPLQWMSLLRPPSISMDNWDIMAVFPDGHVPIFLSLHIGWLGLGLVALGISQFNKYCWSWLVIAAIGVFIALGEHNPLAIPLLKLLNPFRTPEKYLFLFHFAATMLVASGMARLLNYLPSDRSYNIVGSLLLLIMMGELIHAGRNINLVAPAGYYELSESEEARHISQDPGRIYTRSIAQENTNTVRELYTNFRNAMTPNIGAMAGISYVDGVTFLQYSAQNKVQSLIYPLPPGKLLARRLAFLSVRYVITDDPAFAASQGWKMNASQLTPLLWRLNSSAPLLNFSLAVYPSDGSDYALAVASSDLEFSNGNKSFVINSEANVGEKSVGRVLSVKSRSGLYQADVESLGDGWLILRESFNAGWSAKINGEAVEIVRTNQFFMGIKVPQGKHKISFEFRPRQLDLGLFFAALSVIALIALWFGHYRRKNVLA